MPTMVHAGVYSAVTHYLQAVAAANTLDAVAVSAKMHEMTISDAILDGAKIREGGRIMRPYYLFGVESSLRLLQADPRNTAGRGGSPARRGSLPSDQIIQRPGRREEAE
jgi:hypothetical protein